MQYARIVFYLEVLLNLGSALVSFFAPALFIQQYTTIPIAPQPLELTRWYGVLLFVFVYLELRALRSGKNDLLALILEGFLLGDFIQLVALVFFVNTVGGISSTVIITIILTLLLAAVRIYWLLQHRRHHA